MDKIKIKLSFLLILFLCVLFLFELLYFKDVYLVATGDQAKFNLTNFLIYNFSLKIIGYTIKFLVLIGFLKFVLLIFDITIKVPYLKIVLLSEIVYFLLTKGSILIYFFIIDNSLNSTFLSSYESFFSLKTLFMESTTTSSLKYLLSSINLFDVLYTFFLVYLFSECIGKSYICTFKIVGLSYLLLLFVLGIIKTFLSF